MDMVHHIYRLLLGGRLFLAPVSDNVQRVLDLGTGTGIWAMDFAEQVSIPLLLQHRTKPADIWNPVNIHPQMSLGLT